MLLYVRHGESTANQIKVFAGQRLSAPLTDLGRAQAKRAGQELLDRHIKITTIISSPIERALDTAKVIALVIGYGAEEIIVDPRLMEYDMGELVGTKFPDVTSQMITAAAGAEDPVTFRGRVKAAVDDARNYPGNTLIVAHSGIARMSKAIARGIDPKEFHDVPSLPNSEITDFDLWLNS